MDEHGGNGALVELLRTGSISLWNTGRSRASRGYTITKSLKPLLISKHFFSIDTGGRETEEINVEHR
jgi:hypothetical protein